MFTVLELRERHQHRVVLAALRGMLAHQLSAPPTSKSPAAWRAAAVSSGLNENEKR